MNIASLSIVTYKTSVVDFNKIYASLYNSDTHWHLYVIDNSPLDKLRKFLERDIRITYVYNNANIGFGGAHNLAIDLAIKAGSKYHFIINPDIYFDTDVITPMISYMEANADVGMMMPEILNTDGSIQYLPKLLPNPVWIFRRKFKKPKASFNKFIEKYELRNFPKDKVYNAPILSGCFTLLNLNAIAKVGAYDDKFFMYFEDFDLSRRMHTQFKTIYFPLVSVFHGYEGGANKSFTLFKIFLSSAITYFNKWGWFFDSERKIINTNACKQ